MFFFLIFLSFLGNEGLTMLYPLAVAESCQWLICVFCSDTCRYLSRDCFRFGFIVCTFATPWLLISIYSFEARDRNDLLYFLNLFWSGDKELLDGMSPWRLMWWQWRNIFQTKAYSCYTYLTMQTTKLRCSEHRTQTENFPGNIYCEEVSSN